MRLPLFLADPNAAAARLGTVLYLPVQVGGCFARFGMDLASSVQDVARCGVCRSMRCTLAIASCAHFSSVLRCFVPLRALRSAASSLWLGMSNVRTGERVEYAVLPDAARTLSFRQSARVAVPVLVEVTGHVAGVIVRRTRLVRHAPVPLLSCVDVAGHVAWTGVMLPNYLLDASGPDGRVDRGHPARGREGRGADRVFLRHGSSSQGFRHHAAPPVVCACPQTVWGGIGGASDADVSAWKRMALLRPTLVRYILQWLEKQGGTGCCTEW